MLRPGTNILPSALRADIEILVELGITHRTILAMMTDQHIDDLVTVVADHRHHAETPTSQPPETCAVYPQLEQTKLKLVPMPYVPLNRWRTVCRRSIFFWSSIDDVTYPSTIAALLDQ